MKRTILGKSGIKVTILADSINAAGNRMLTFELEYPRLILAELNTHRMLSKNSFSSRAVPFEKMLKQLDGIPVRFGANQAGMQDKGEDFAAAIELKGHDHLFNPEGAWEEAKDSAIEYAQAFKNAGYHKQVYNRLLEPFQMMKTILSGTELSNFFWLRDDQLADPTLGELARCMREAVAESTPRLLKSGDWHLPYVDCVNASGKQEFYIFDVPDDLSLPVTRTYLSLEDAIKVSCARCAAVSYRNEGYGVEKSIELYERLVGSEKKHASALEHCATPMQGSDNELDVLDRSDCVNIPMFFDTWEPGVTHVDRAGNLWSGNLKGFVQHRKLIPGENYEE